MIQCQHVQISHPAEFILNGRWAGCATVSCLLCSEEGENTRICSSSSLANHVLYWDTAEHKRDFGEMESWTTDIPDSVFVLHRYDWMKRSTYLDNLWLLWRFPSRRFHLHPLISPERCMPNVGPKPINHSTEELTEDGDLHESASRRPSICLAFPALTASRA
jgi:hypothetical protein